MRSTYKHIWLIGGVLLISSGCSSTSLPQTKSSQVQATSSVVTPVITPTRLSDELLTLFPQPALRTLVQQTLTQNYDLRQTALRLQEQGVLTKQAQAQRVPTLNADVSSQRNRDTVSTSQHSLGMNINWELDVWRRLADSVRVSQSQERAQQWQYQAAKNSLAARVMQRWIDISLRQQMLKAERDWVASLQQTEAVIVERYRDGVGALADLETARAATARTRASLSAREQTQRDAYRQLALWQGKTVQVAQLPSIDTVLTVRKPPSQIAAATVAKRPDVQAAYQHIVAAHAQAAVAHKQLLPSFSLSSTLSQARPQLGDLLSGSVAWNVLGRLTAPLFDGGRLKAGAKLADLQAEGSYLAYQQTLLNALHEVDAALGQEASLAEQQQHLQTALQHAQASLKHYQGRYREGLGDILELLNAQQSLFSARIQLLQLQQARLSNRISLGLALGMGV